MTQDMHRPDDAAAAGDGDRGRSASAAQQRDAGSVFEDSVQAFAAAHPGAQEWLGALAHELRNPLAPLGSSIELLRRDDLPEPARYRALDVMSRQLAQLRQVIDALARQSQTKVQARPGGQADPSATPAGGAATKAVATGMAAAGPAEAAKPTASAPAAPVIADPIGITATAPALDADVQRASRRVLIADDNELVQQAMAQLLTSEGFEVRTACDGIEAIDLAAQWSPRFVILDAYMPRLSGIEAARRLRALNPPERMTLLLMSGVALTQAWIEHAREVGFDDCLDKGAPPAQWLARLRLDGTAPG